MTRRVSEWFYRHPFDVDAALWWLLYVGLAVLVIAATTR